MRLNLFDLIDREAWPLPVDIRIDESEGFPDVIIGYDRPGAIT